MDGETKYWVAFSVFPGVGPVRFRLLLEYFGSARAAWNASESELRSVGMPQKLTDALIGFRRTFSPDAYIHELHAKQVSTLTLTDPKYPGRLREIPDPPFVLYIKGKKNIPPIDFARTVGVVGTRKITPYGQEVTRRLVEGLVSYGFTIVSGLAYGVDAVAHRTAIDAGGKTIAVLGCGIDIIAPPSNARLYHDIESGHGAIVSEMPLGLRPNKGLFPARNRIISGLSLGVIVTEGAEDSGALITARNAAEQGRDVFAVPGPVTSVMSRGPSKLLKNGARLVESALDVIEEFGMDTVGRPASRDTVVGDTAAEQKILDILRCGPVHVNTVAKMADLTIQTASSTITVLEIKGKIRDIGEKVYSLT